MKVWVIVLWVTTPCSLVEVTSTLKVEAAGSPKRCYPFIKLHGDWSQETVILSVAGLYLICVPVELGSKSWWKQLSLYLENVIGHTGLLTVKACGMHSYHCLYLSYGHMLRQLDAVLQDPVCGVKVNLMRVTVPWWGNGPLDFTSRLKQGPALQ
jgi:hypothetical protein